MPIGDTVADATILHHVLHNVIQFTQREQADRSVTLYRVGWDELL